LAAQAVAEFEALGSPLSALEAGLVRAEAAIASDRPEQALSIVAEAEAAARGQEVALQPQVQVVRARALLALDRIAEAAESVSAGVASARAQDMPYEEARLLELRAVVTMRTGSAGADQEAAADAARAHDLLSAMDIPS
jgi:hypothetical protein